MADYVEASELERQKRYMIKIKASNERFRARTGRAPVAVTQTYGCQQNENDTERIRGMLQEAGYQFGDDEKTADLVIYNTCAVRENAEQKVFGRLGILKHLKERRPELVIGLCGCMVQQGHIAEKIRET